MLQAYRKNLEIITKLTQNGLVKWYLKYYIVAIVPARLEN